VQGAVPRWGRWAYLLSPALFLALSIALRLPDAAVPLIVLCYVGLILAAQRTRLTVGLDGLLHRWLLRTELLRWLRRSPEVDHLCS